MKITFSVCALYVTYIIYCFNVPQMLVMFSYLVLKLLILLLVSKYYKRLAFEGFDGLCVWILFQVVMLWLAIAVLPTDAHFVVKSFLLPFLSIFPICYAEQMFELMRLEFVYCCIRFENDIKELSSELSSVNLTIQDMMPFYRYIQSKNLCNKEKEATFDTFFNSLIVRANRARIINNFVQAQTIQNNVVATAVPQSVVAIAGPQSVVAPGWRPIRRLREIEVPNLAEFLEPMHTVTFGPYQQMNETIFCGICHMDLTQNCRVAFLSCFEKHIFHQSCIMNWWKTRSTCKCVLCKSDINFQYPRKVRR